MSRQTLACEPAGLVTRRGPDGGLQTLVFTNETPKRVRPLEGGDTAPYSLGPPLQLMWESQLKVDADCYCSPDADCYCSPVYDTASDCVYWREGYAIMRLNRRNGVTLVAGSTTESGRADGVGEAARFEAHISHRGMTGDGRGTLYILSGSGQAVRKVTVAGDAIGVARVTTVPLTAPGVALHCLAYYKADGLLLGASDSALYRLMPPSDLLALLGARALRAELIAGQEGNRHHEYSDGVGRLARFYAGFPSVTTVDSNGCAYMCERNGSRLWKVDTTTRRVTTLLTDLPSGVWGPCILPLGCLALVYAHKLVLLTDFGTVAAEDAAVGGSAIPGVQTPLVETFSQLLTGPVVELKVGGQCFHAHKGLLEQHLEYFKGLLSGGFAEGGAAEVELPDADPDAFAALLQYFYTRRMCVPDPLLRPVAELAGRLLAGGAVSELTPRLLAATSPATIAADLLWAERHNLTGLLPGLRTYFLAHASQAMAAAPDSMSLLVKGSPELAAELMGAMAAERA